MKPIDNIFLSEYDRAAHSGRAAASASVVAQGFSEPAASAGEDISIANRSGATQARGNFRLRPGGADTL